MAHVPNTTTRLLSSPSKMPGKSFGLPAHRACPRANGSICRLCYASKGCYVWRTVREAYEKRFQWVVECMRTEAGRIQFVDVMVRTIGKQKSEYFRIHDSGDFFNLQYAQCWVEICRRLPRIRFWAPTRVWQSPTPAGPFRIMDEDPIMNAVRELAALPNVTVRPSALDFGTPPPAVAGLAAGSTAAFSGSTVFACPAKSQGNQCGECRVCWDAPDTAVSYSKH